jgi:predicted nucleic acid-binding protein
MGTLIDTSVWIDAFHPKTPREIKEMAGMAINHPGAVLCEPVYVEFFRGIPDREMDKMQGYIATIPMLLTPVSLWKEAIPLLRSCMKNGTPVNILDTLIAIIALKNEVTVVTFDTDFLTLQKHCGVEVELLSREN